MQLMNKEEIATLKARISDIKNRLPAHSVKPGMLQELEQLEEELLRLIKLSELDD